MKPLSEQDPSDAKRQRQERVRSLNADLRRRMKQKQFSRNSKTCKERSLEKSLLSKSQSSFEVSLLQRTVLMSNNRALAKALETGKLENRSLMNTVGNLRQENLELNIRINALQFVRRDVLELEEDKATVNALVQRVMAKFKDTADIMETLVQCCSKSSQRAAVTKDNHVAQRLPVGGNTPIISGPSRIPDTLWNTGLTQSDFSDEDRNATARMRNLFNMTPIMEVSFSECCQNVASALSDEEDFSNDETLKESECTESFLPHSRRLTYAVPESQQVLDLPTPIKNLRGKLRRTTWLPWNCLQLNEVEANDENAERSLQESTVSVPVDMEFTEVLTTPIIQNTHAGALGLCCNGEDLHQSPKLPLLALRLAALREMVGVSKASDKEAAVAVSSPSDSNVASATETRTGHDGLYGETEISRQVGEHANEQSTCVQPGARRRRRTTRASRKGVAAARSPSGSPIEAARCQEIVAVSGGSDLLPTSPCLGSPRRDSKLPERKSVAALGLPSATVIGNASKRNSKAKDLQLIGTSEATQQWHVLAELGDVLGERTVLLDCNQSQRPLSKETRKTKKIKVKSPATSSHLNEHNENTPPPRSLRARKDIAYKEISIRKKMRRE